MTERRESSKPAEERVGGATPPAPLPAAASKEIVKRVVTYNNEDKNNTLTV